MRHRSIAPLLACWLSVAGTACIAAPIEVPAVISVEAKPPNLVVHGSYLTKIYLFGFPTGTGITTAALIGEATRQGPPGPNEIWILPIADDDDFGSFTSIYAQGVDSHGDSAGTKDFPFVGASDIYDALHGRTSPN